MVERVRLTGLSEATDFERKPAWSVTLSFFPSDVYSEPMLSATFVIAKSDYDEADVVRVARHFFQGLTSHLGEETAAWKLEKDALEALKKHGTKRQSASTA